MSENDELVNEKTTQAAEEVGKEIKFEETEQESPEPDQFSMESRQEADKAVSALLQDLKTGQNNMAIDLAALKDRIEQLVSTVEKAPDTEENAIAQALSRIDGNVDKLCQSNRSALESFGEFRANLGRGWHDELKQYRELFSLGAYDNLLKKLGEIYIAIFNLIKEKNDAQFKEDMEWTALEPLRELMESYGVSIRISEPGSKRSLRSMRSVRKHFTGDRSMEGLIACSVAPGFLRSGENEIGAVVLIPEEVEHYSYKPDIVETNGDVEGQNAAGLGKNSVEADENNANQQN